MKDSSPPLEALQFPPEGISTSGYNLPSGLSKRAHGFLFITCYQDLITPKIDLIRLNRWWVFLKLNPPLEVQARLETHTVRIQRLESQFYKPAALCGFVISAERTNKKWRYWLVKRRWESEERVFCGGVYQRSIKRSKTEKKDDNSRCQLLSEENQRDLAGEG